ncbi:MAG: hypothetical protein R6V32_05500 [Bacteroidales bacterium]
MTNKTDKTLNEKIRKAEAIIKQEKEDILQIFTSEYSEKFGNPKDFLPMFEEDTKYKIRALNLPKTYLQHYLNKVCEIYGPFSEDQPNKKEKYYGNDFYMK